MSHKRMSHNRSILIGCAIIGAALIHAAPVLAQQTPPPAADRRGPARRGPPTIDERVARMTTELGLSADQATRIRAVMTAEQRGMDSVLARRTAARDAERAAMMATQTNTQKAMAAVLTADQKLKHDAMRARQGGPGGMRHRGQDGGGRGGRAGMRDGRGDRRGPSNAGRRGPPNDDAATR